MAHRRRPGTISINTFTQASKPKKDRVIKINKKGNNDVIEVDQLEEIIRYLARYHDRKIKNLTGKLRENYFDLLSYVQALHGSHHYGILRNLIKKYYNPKAKSRPYTIGSYLFGCFSNGDQEDQSCSPLCSGSIKDDPYGEDFCQYPVVNAEWDSNRGFTFDLSDEEYIDATPVVYVPFREMSRFPGFNSEEKSWFTRKGFHKIYLRGTSDYMTYVSLQSGNQPISLNRVKTRSNNVEINVPIEGGSRGILLLGALAIFFIIIFIFLWTGYSSSRRSPRRETRPYGRYHRYRS